MKIRMLVLALLVVTAATAFASDTKKKYEEKNGQVSWVGIDGLVHRAYTQEHLQKIRDTYGDEIGKLVQDAHDAGGRPRVADALKLKAKLAIIGVGDEAANAIVRDYLKKASGKKLDDALENALVDQGYIPAGLKGTGRTLGGLLELARDHAILGGSDPAQGLTPGLVKGIDDVKHGRRSFEDFMLEFGAAIGAEAQGDAPADDTKPGSNGNDDNGAGDDELGGGYQHEDHSDTERGDEPNDPDPGTNPEGNDDPGATDDQGGTNANTNNGGTYTVDEVNHNDDGTTDVTFHVSGSDGNDGIYTTTYNDDGTYTTTNTLTGEVVGTGTGTAPDVEPGDTTTTTDGDQAIFPSKDDGDDDDGDDGADGDEEEKKDDDSTTNAPSAEMEGDPAGDDGAPLPDEIQQMIDAQLAADLKRLKGGDHVVDDENCGGDGKHKSPKATPKISVAEAAAIAQAKKLKMIGNPTGVEHVGGGPANVPGQDGGDIDYGPDHVDDRELGSNGVDPRGTQKIGAGHHSDDGGVKSASGTSAGGTFGSGGNSSTSSDSSKGKSKSKGTTVTKASKLQPVDPAAKVKRAGRAIEPTPSKKTQKPLSSPKSKPTSKKKS